MGSYYDYGGIEKAINNLAKAVDNVASAIVKAAEIRSK